MTVSYGYSDDATFTNPVKGTGFDTPQVTGAIVIGALVFLIAVRRGFRGVNIGGAGVRLG